MQALAVYGGTEIAPQQELTSGLFHSFVKWIDRGEKTTRTYIVNLRQFMAWLKYTDTPRPMREDIISYRQWLAAEHEAIQFDPVTGWKYRTDSRGNPVKINCKPNTIAQYLRIVRQFFQWTSDNGLYPNVARNIHAPKVSSNTRRKDYLRAGEVLAIEKSIAQQVQEVTAAAAKARKDKEGRVQRSTEQGKRLYAMYLLTVTLGLRTIEINRANIKDIETRNGNAWIRLWRKGKTEADQEKPLPPEVKAAIDDYLQSRTDHYTGASPLFVSTGNRSGGKRLATTTISAMLKKAMQEAGFDSERLTAHSLRHSAAMAALEVSGNNIYEAQMYLGHASPNTTMHYLHQTEEAEQKQVSMANSIYHLFHGEE
jgi:integrase/recombinase XerC